MDTIYCPYTDQRIPKAEAKGDHIIPHSLGGLDGFEILCDPEFNHTIGSQIEGKLANDPIIELARRRHDARGHSGKPVQPRWKKASLNDRTPVRMDWDPDRLRLWNPRDQEYLPGKPIREVTVQAPAIDMDVRLQLVAKVALGGGYFIFGDVFRHHVAHRELRLIMERGPSNPPDDPTISLRGIDGLQEPREQDRIAVDRCRELFSRINGSAVLFEYEQDRLLISVGILEHYIGTLNVEAAIAKFPNEAEYRHGHAVFLQLDEIQRGSADEVFRQLAHALGIEIPGDT